MESLSSGLNDCWREASPEHKEGMKGTPGRGRLVGTPRIGRYGSLMGERLGILGGELAGKDCYVNLPTTCPLPYSMAKLGTSLWICFNNSILSFLCSIALLCAFCFLYFLIMAQNL